MGENCSKVAPFVDLFIIVPHLGPIGAWWDYGLGLMLFAKVQNTFIGIISLIGNKMFRLR